MLDEDVIVGGKYLMGRKIGSGSFGSIVLGTDIETAKYVAIKFVKINVITLNSFCYRKNLQSPCTLSFYMRLKF